MMTGSWFASKCSRIAFSVSSPDRFGIIQSRMTRSGGDEETTAKRRDAVLAHRGLIAVALELPLKHDSIVLDVVDDEDLAVGEELRKIGENVHAATASFSDCATSRGEHSPFM